MTMRTIWLASYPKSGNTWVRALLTGLQLGSTLDINGIGYGAMPVGRKPLRQWLGIPLSDLTDAELARSRPLFDAELNASLKQICFRKIHDALMFDAEPIVPPAATLGAIYIVRDPRAVAVSFAHHFEVDLEATVRLMADRAGRLVPDKLYSDPQLPQHLGTWSGHVCGWLEHDLFPTLLVRYEDLHADPARELARIVAFAGLEVSDESIARAVEAAAFDRLKSQEASAPFWERVASDVPFFRRGQIAGWREELPEVLARQIEADHAETMGWLGYAQTHVLARDPHAAR